MSPAESGGPLVERQGWTDEIDAVVVACTWVGRSLVIADGDGRLSWIDPDAPQLAPQPRHDGAILAAAAAPDGSALVAGGDDGCLICHTPAGTAQELARFSGRWIEHLLISTTGLGVCAVGKDAIVFDRRSGTILRTFPHTSSIGGLALDPKGRRVAASHYGGVTLWWLGLDGGNPRPLEWKGSHLAVTWHPGGRFIVSAMQDAMLHGWRIDDGAHMRMSGYASKTRAFSWSIKGRWLATGGAPRAVCWPFNTADGPMGQSPQQCGDHGLGVGNGTPLVTQVAFHPKEDVLAVGYDDGCIELVRLADGASSLAVAPDAGAVTSLTWNRDGSMLASGSETGRIALIRVRRSR